MAEDIPPLSLSTGSDNPLTYPFEVFERGLLPNTTYSESLYILKEYLGKLDQEPWHSKGISLTETIERLKKKLARSLEGEVDIEVETSFAELKDLFDERLPWP